MDGVNTDGGAATTPTSEVEAFDQILGGADPSTFNEQAESPPEETPSPEPEPATAPEAQSQETPPPEPDKPEPQADPEVTASEDGQPEEKPEEPAFDPDAEIRKAQEALGLKHEEETVDSMKEKYANSSAEAHRLVEERKQFQELLDQRGLEVITDKKGSLALKAKDDFVLPEEWSSDVPMTEEMRDLAQHDAAAFAKEVERQTVARMQEQYPVADQGPNAQNYLTQDVIIEEFNTFANAKGADGELLHKYANQDSVVGTMEGLYEQLPAGLKHAYATDRESCRVIFANLYDKTAEVRGIIERAETEKARAKQENELEASVSPEGTQSAPTPKTSRDKTPADLVVEQMMGATLR
jgi:hypothetical protein